MSWFNKCFEKFKTQGKAVIITLIFAKFLAGVGLGALLASYFGGYDWILCGWLLIVISLIVHIPAVYTVLLKK
ncbi:hypothetical protein KJA17_00740 [Patescibacteria group bacterium]|nr:hypothetical protein [Patescibacteria group bacterium]